VTGWKLIIHDFDQQELCSDHDIFAFQLKCRCASLALRRALEDVANKTWLEPCNDALESIDRLDGMVHFKNNVAVSRWHLTFGQNNKAFPNPQAHISLMSEFRSDACQLF
jgi:hypothetical protein